MNWHIVLTEDEYNDVGWLINDMENVKILSSYHSDLNHPKQRSGRVKFVVFSSEEDAIYVCDLIKLEPVDYNHLELKQGYPDFSD